MATEMTLEIMKIKAINVFINIDGSINNDVQKRHVPEFLMYIVCVYLRLLTCLSSSSVAVSIFNRLDEVLMMQGLNWSRCVGLSVDYTNVSVGKRNSGMT